MLTQAVLSLRGDRPLILALFTLLLLPVGDRRGSALTPGLPFTEGFAGDTLQDPLLTNANWSADEEALILAWRQKQFGVFLCQQKGLPPLQFSELGNV